MLNRTDRGHTIKKKNRIACIKKIVHNRVYKCTAILHVPMGKAHRKNSTSKLDNDAKRVATIYMELPTKTMRPKLIYMSACTKFQGKRTII